MHGLASQIGTPAVRCRLMTQVCFVGLLVAASLNLISLYSDYARRLHWIQRQGGSTLIQLQKGDMSVAIASFVMNVPKPRSKIYFAYLTKMYGQEGINYMVLQAAYLSYPHTIYIRDQLPPYEADYIISQDFYVDKLFAKLDKEQHPYVAVSRDPEFVLFAKTLPDQ